MTVLQCNVSAGLDLCICVTVRETTIVTFLQRFDFQPCCSPYLDTVMISHPSMIAHPRRLGRGLNMTGCDVFHCRHCQYPFGPNLSISTIVWYKYINTRLVQFQANTIRASSCSHWHARKQDLRNKPSMWTSLEGHTTSKLGVCDLKIPMWMQVLLWFCQTHAVHMETAEGHLYNCECKLSHVA